VLRRDFDEMKKDLAEVKVTQHEMMNEMREGMQRITIAIEKLEKSSRNVSNVVKSMNCDIVLIGGMEPKSTKALSSVERFNILTQTWTSLAELKIGRFGAAAVVFENQILVCGGSIGDNANKPTVTDSIEVLDLNVNPPTWQEFAVNLPVMVVGHMCVVYGNRLLIFGGQTNGKTLDTIYELLLVPPYSSKLLCHMKKERIFHGVELLDDKVLIACGQWTGNDVEIFDITRNECVEMPPLPSPLWGLTTVRRGDTMLLIGGQDNEGNFRNEIIEYDFNSGQSKVLVVMERDGVVCSAVYSGNTLVVISATDGDPCSVYCFNFLSNAWKNLPSISKARAFPSAVVVSNFGYWQFVSDTGTPV
jgi:hypothetical protein